MQMAIIPVHTSDGYLWKLFSHPLVLIAMESRLRTSCLDPSDPMPPIYHEYAISGLKSLKLSCMLRPHLIDSLLWNLDKQKNEGILTSHPYT